MLDIPTEPPHPGTLLVGIPKAVSVFDNVDLVRCYLLQTFRVRPVRMPGRLRLCGADAHLLDEVFELVLRMKGLPHIT